MSASGPGMHSGEVVSLMAVLAEAGVEAWVHRGWGVDALVGEQTREHRDLDLVTRPGDVERAAAALVGAGFRINDDRDPLAVELLDPRDRPVDIRGDASVEHPGFGATGRLAGAPVPCVSAEVQLADRARGRLTDTDLQAIRLLHGQLGVPLPARLHPLRGPRVGLALRRLVRPLRKRLRTLLRP